MLVCVLIMQEAFGVAITGNIFYSASSGTVTTIQCVYASISASTAIDTQYSTWWNAAGFSFGFISVTNTQLKVPITRNVAITADQTYNLVAYATGTGSLAALTYSSMNARRIV